MIKEEYIDYLLVPSGLVFLGIYHLWLLLTIIKNPTRTVIGLNAISRYQWVQHMMRVSLLPPLLLLLLFF
ncbi:Interleukin-1 receptor antagonist protein [Bienertia sinuspersici]